MLIKSNLHYVSVEAFTVSIKQYVDIISRRHDLA